MRPRIVILILVMFILPLVVPGANNPISIVNNASAADACEGDTEAVSWNESLQRIAMVPHYNPYDSWWDIFDEGPGKGKNRGGNDASNDQQEVIDMSLSPEPEWMYYAPWEQEEVNLDTLTSNHYTTLIIGNDSVGALKLNLSANHRTTICITLQDFDQVNGSEVNADIYLLTSSEYEKYEESYYSSHSNNRWYSDAEESLSDIPPEWRSFNFLGWKSYRDAHQYENVDEVNFALSLDGPEVYSGLFGNQDWQDFYIIIDTWDNVHDNDAPPPETITAADVTIITTERTLILPNFTVSLVFLVLIVGFAIFPFILNARYMRAGLQAEQQTTGIVPSLNTAPELPPVDHNYTDAANTKADETG